VSDAKQALVLHVAGATEPLVFALSERGAKSLANRLPALMNSGGVDTPELADGKHGGGQLRPCGERAPGRAAAAGPGVRQRHPSGARVHQVNRLIPPHPGTVVRDSLAKRSAPEVRGCRVTPEEWLANFEATIAEVRQKAAEFKENWRPPAPPRRPRTARCGSRSRRTAR